MCPSVPPFYPRFIPRMAEDEQNKRLRQWLGAESIPAQVALLRAHQDRLRERLSRKPELRKNIRSIENLIARAEAEAAAVAIDNLMKERT